MAKKIIHLATTVRLTVMRFDYLLPVASMVLGIGSTILTWR